MTQSEYLEKVLDPIAMFIQEVCTNPHGATTESVSALPDVIDAYLEIVVNLDRPATQKSGF